ncbi:hypothetical protein HanIR_Chr05g0246281 [Helianthus annuus]|nr:hypothetical protein HanIR_Chr05g0246281 [Helianthus annuus]
MSMPYYIMLYVLLFVLCYSSATPFIIAGGFHGSSFFILRMKIKFVYISLFHILSVILLFV